MTRLKKFRGGPVRPLGLGLEGVTPPYFWVEGKVFGFLHLAALT